MLLGWYIWFNDADSFYKIFNESVRLCALNMRDTKMTSKVQTAKYIKSLEFTIHDDGAIKNIYITLARVLLYVANSIKKHVRLRQVSHRT